MKRKKIVMMTCAALAGATALFGSACSSAVKRADINKDGKISTDELERALVLAVFEAADDNGNGSVTFEEWKKVFPKTTKSKFSSHDLGRTGAFTLDEALTYCKKHKSFTKLVKGIDDNSDGFIDKEEATKFHEKMQASEGDNSLEKLKTLVN
ncbi:MAG: hypothetical protein L3J39_16455 [Verrucomicrobiales bacterium]|nr:hypothetical protein [Verrucomicrobiales bacterium]